MNLQYACTQVGQLGSLQKEELHSKEMTLSSFCTDNHKMLRLMQKKLVNRIDSEILLSPTVRYFYHRIKDLLLYLSLCDFIREPEHMSSFISTG